MKKLCVVLMSAVALLAQTQAVKPKGKTKKAPVAAQQPAPLTAIPANAVKEGNHYHWVDPQGKAWSLQETPFGIKKMPAEATPAVASVAPTTTSQPTAAAKPVAPSVTAVEDGEMIRFSKPSPFGVSTWQKKKTDLNAEEQQIWQREQAQRQQ